MIVHSLILQYLKYSVSCGGRGCDTIMRLVIKVKWSRHWKTLTKIFPILFFNSQFPPRTFSYNSLQFDPSFDCGLLSELSWSLRYLSPFGDWLALAVTFPVNVVGEWLGLADGQFLSGWLGLAWTEVATSPVDVIWTKDVVWLPSITDGVWTKHVVLPLLSDGLLPSIADGVLTKRSRFGPKSNCQIRGRLAWACFSISSRCRRRLAWACCSSSSL